MAKGKNGNCLEAIGTPTRSGPGSGSYGAAYNNFFKSKMAEIDRTAAKMAPISRMHPEDVSEILKRGGLALLAGTVLLGPLGFAGAIGYIGFKAVRAWKKTRAPAFGQDGQPLLDAQGRPLDQLGRPIESDKEGTFRALRNAGLGGLLLGGGLAVATGGALLPMAAAGALGATGYHAVKNWKKLQPEPEAGQPLEATQEQIEDIGTRALESLTRSKEGQEMLEQTALSIYSAGGDEAGEEACIRAISQDLDCDQASAAVLYQAVRAGADAGVLPGQAIFSGKSHQKEQTSAEPARQSPGSSPDLYICGHPRRDGGVCKMAAGWATATPGKGPCVHHLSSSPASPAPTSPAAATGEDVPGPAETRVASRADLLRKGQEAWQKAKDSGQSLTPEYIASQMAVSDTEAEKIYKEMQTEYSKQEKAPASRSKNEASKIKPTAGNLKNEEDYKKNDPASESLKKKTADLAARGKITEAISAFDVAYFSPQERLRIIRSSYTNAFRDPKMTRDNVSAVADSYERAGLDDVAKEIRGASQERVSKAAEEGLESVLSGNRLDYWKTDTLKHEMFSASLNRGLGAMARQSFAESHAQKVLTSDDYKAYSALRSESGVSERASRAVLLSALSMPTSKAAKAKSKQERSRLLLEEYQKAVSKHLSLQANK